MHQAASEQMNVKTLAISCVTDYCSNVGNNSTTHEEVLKNAEKGSQEFVKLVKTIVKKQALPK